MDNTPWDLISMIVKFLSVGDITNLSLSSRYFLENISSRFNEYIYQIASNTTSDLKLEYLRMFFSKYIKGVSYISDGGCHNPDGTNGLFSLQSKEYILFSFGKIREDYYVLILTINESLRYTTYRFAKITDKAFRYSGAGYYSEATINLYVLENQEEHMNIKDMIRTKTMHNCLMLFPNVI